MSDEAFLGLREAVTKALRMGGTDLLTQPQRLINYLLDLADQTQPEVRMVAHQLDDELVAPLIGAMESGTEVSLKTARSRVREILERERFVNKEMAFVASDALVGGLADYLGVPFATEAPPTSSPAKNPTAQQATSNVQQSQPTGGIPTSGPALPNSTVVSQRVAYQPPQQSAPQPVMQPAPQPAHQPASQQYQTQPAKKSFIIPLVAVIVILAIAVLIALPMLNKKDGNSIDPSSVSVIVNDEAHPLAGESYSVGNLINGGHMACDTSGTIYYADPIDGTDWNTRSIVCYDNGTTVYNAPSTTSNVYHINAVGDKLVFNQVIEGNSTVECINNDGSGHKTLSSCDDWSLCQVDDGWVYYLKDGTINRCDVDGDNHKTLAKVGKNTLWRVCDSKLYTFDEESARTVYVSDLDGSNRETAYTASSGHTIKNAVPLEGDKVCVWEEGSDMRVGLVTSRGGSMDVLYSNKGDIQRICPYEDGVIITLYENDTASRFIVVDYGGNQIVDYNEYAGHARYTCKLDHGIVYGITDDNLQSKILSLPMPGYGNGITIIAE